MRGAEDEDVEVDELVLDLGLVDLGLELGIEVLAGRDVCGVSAAESDDGPENMRVSLLVYSKPQASLSLEIMLASASSEADAEWISRWASDLE